MKKRFNQKNSSELCCGVKNKEGVGMEGETTCPLPIQNSFLNPFDTTQLCCGELHLKSGSQFSILDIAKHLISLKKEPL